jgi:transposase-like protein
VPLGVVELERSTGEVGRRVNVLGFCAFPEAHWRKSWSTNSLDRVNGEIERRTRVVGILPNDEAVLGLVAPSSPKPTTNGKTPNVASSPITP